MVTAENEDALMKDQRTEGEQSNISGKAHF